MGTVFGQEGKIVPNRFGIPKADYFTENNNFYTGSLMPLNYRVDAAGDMIQMSVWYGKMCMARSKLEAQKEFSKDAAGYDAAMDWLEEQYQVCLQKTKED
ncbi:hypothetical protein B6259_00880 [Ruminococcaceae bacterium CPB6]|jgi:hypothetical protein|nr:hypothetical protein B6259_00880 [Ruminococcaceae bacterium CPB6]